MTREEAIKIIDCYDIGFYDLSGEKIPADKLVEAFDMAIEALSAEDEQGVGRYENAMQKLRDMPRYLNGVKEKQIIKISTNYTTEKPSDVVEQKNDVVAEPTDLISRADAIKYIDRVINSGLGRNKSLDYIHKYISALPSADRPTLKQTDTMIIADALRYLMKDEERNLVDRVRADVLREQFLNYGAKMGSDTR